MRHLHSHEVPLLKHLLGAARLEVDVDQLLVEPMADGGMGSLQLHPPRGDRRMGSEVASCEFTDSDGVAVSATLNLDEQERLFELDVWKVDFSQLNRWPTANDLRESGDLTTGCS
jgi:hypothetical protein